jgi:hypothetical protein
MSRRSTAIGAVREDKDKDVAFTQPLQRQFNRSAINVDDRRDSLGEIALPFQVDGHGASLLGPCPASDEIRAIDPVPIEQ